MPLTKGRRFCLVKSVQKNKLDVFKSSLTAFIIKIIHDVVMIVLYLYSTQITSKQTITVTTDKMRKLNFLIFSKDQFI